VDQGLRWKRLFRNGRPSLVLGLAERVAHFSILFRKLTGYAPRHYLTRLRIHRAAQLLGTGKVSVKAISQRLGYQDPLHFSRAFRQINGLSPSQYRELRQRQSDA
jgi:transcriptional regulator GlxA family with amidase domain